jgi:hypothetical protein
VLAIGTGRTTGTTECGRRGKAALGGRFADRERRYLVVNGHWSIEMAMSAFDRDRNRNCAPSSAKELNGDLLTLAFAKTNAITLDAVCAGRDRGKSDGMV